MKYCALLQAEQAAASGNACVPEVAADLHEPYVVRLALLFGAVAGLYLTAVRPTALPAV